MKKLIAGINMTLDGVCDHTAVAPDDEVHEHYSELLRSGDAILYGRTTYQLMEYWRDLVANPSGNKASDEFAIIMNNISKVVFSHTLKSVDWKSARLATKSLEEEILELKQQPGKDIFVGSPGLIVQAMNLGLVDELQLMVHPVIAGKGMKLFKDIHDRSELKLIKTKTFGCGAVILYYEPGKSHET
ncbi:MAG: dihydrofolate reductase [Candidatus Fluviicola riflensis]|nr:MAG: dihydrofolate reductase [Candidatus Fluviicola riflensis]OGS79631.1 MAG: dihydrofolate reductase [Candidatus Fluviicola riflensis]OGS87062.1 MAG: dihydrofolate reductase [Fluviicola sp. RIFCSPHIGHO2_01_FULL_43_53]OGS89854.1 MAG: dihydrofolate reductase [Fluviicola sp. RIFCSPHIGHO2_12_FULL_43_24]